MIFEPHWVDVTPFLLKREQPVFILPRESAHSEPKAWAGASKVGTVGEFWVPHGDLLGGEAVFAPTTAGEAVRIPVWAYQTVRRTLPDIFGLGLQIGMAAIAEMRKYTRDEPRRVHLVLGHECTDLLPAAESFRCYIGIAVRTK